MGSPPLHQSCLGTPLPVFPHPPQGSGLRLLQVSLYSLAHERYAAQLENTPSLPPCQVPPPGCLPCPSHPSLLEGLTFAPMINSLLLPDLPPLPDDATMSAAYRALLMKARSLMIDHWLSFSPAPAYYTFPLSLSPHPFMWLGKFMAGRIHQMRAQKWYLAANPSWCDLSPTNLCPLCGDEQETFSHAILRCPAKAPARLRHLQGLALVVPDSPL